MAKAASKIKSNRFDDLEAQFARRLVRFRVLVCVNGQDASYDSVNLAARLCKNETADIVLLYVRNIDQGLNAGGLQVRTARRNLLEWGLELPGIKYLRRGYELLMEQQFLGEEWEEHVSHSDVFGDPLGDNKVEYRGTNGRRIVLKLKTAADASAGILHQYELGPYNMIMMGPSQQWSASWRTMLQTKVVQKVASLVPATVMTVRNPCQDGAGFLLSTDGTDFSLEAKRRGAVIARELGEPVHILGTADDDSALGELEGKINQFAAGLKKDGFQVKDVRVMVGNPVRSTVELGNRCSAIVVSDKQTSRFNRFFKGSVAFDIMQLATTSVINVR